MADTSLAEKPAAAPRLKATSAARDAILELKTRIGKSVLGQDHLVESMLIGLLANGNLLIESLPGLAKTRAVKTLAKNLAADLSRVQFTPDLLPSDVTGAEIYVQTEKSGQFQFQKGPIFANLVLADEINRAPAKVQSALLEAMEERQVTVAGKTYKMPALFMVLATENPIEQEGTYPLPEAQLDRFLMHVVVTYPNEGTEGEIIKLNRDENAQAPKAAASEPAAVPQQAIFDARGEIDKVFVSDLAQKYNGRCRFRDALPEPLRRAAEQMAADRREPARQPRSRSLRARARLA
jgi:MoxR-like ATPase